MNKYQPKYKKPFPMISSDEVYDKFVDGIRNLGFNLEKGLIREVTDVQISGRNEEGYPTHFMDFTFCSVKDLSEQIDKVAEELEYTKIDVLIEDTECFSDEELKQLENEGIEIN